MHRILAYEYSINKCCKFSGNIRQGTVWMFQSNFSRCFFSFVCNFKQLENRFVCRLRQEATISVWGNVSRIKYTVRQGRNVDDIDDFRNDRELWIFQYRRRRKESNYRPNSTSSRLISHVLLRCDPFTAVYAGCFWFATLLQVLHIHNVQKI